MSGHRDRMGHYERVVIDHKIQEHESRPLECIRKAQGKSPFSLDYTYHGCLKTLTCFLTWLFLNTAR